MEPLYGILYLAFSAWSTANWVPPPQPVPGSFTPNGPPAPPSFTVPQPPTAFFRELLVANAQQRHELLAKHPPGEQRFLISKVQYYESLSPEQTEEELRALELRWYLAFLMRQPPTNRTIMLKDLPEKDRRLVETRLAFWDRLSADLQDSILKNEIAIRVQYSLPQFVKTLTNLPPIHRRKIADDIARWKAMPAKEQQVVYWSYKQLFELNEPPMPPGAVPPNAMPPPLPVNTLLVQFKQLPSSEQSDCLANFQRFKELPPTQRERFVKAAQRWLNMSEAERQAWRQAVKSGATPPLPARPPMPPGFVPSPRPRSQPLSLDTNK